MTINQCSVFIVTGSYTHIIWEMFVMIYYTACRAKKQQKNPTRIWEHSACCGYRACCAILQLI